MVEYEVLGNACSRSSGETSGDVQQIFGKHQKSPEQTGKSQQVLGIASMLASSGGK
jgi:hypothetical protein